MFGTILVLLGLVFNQTHYKIKVVNHHDNPIEGAYVRINDSFAYSDSLGFVDFQDVNYFKDTLHISHLAYKSLDIPVKKLNNTFCVVMSEDIKRIPEVVISKFNEKEFVKRAIDSISVNYKNPYSPSLWLKMNVNVTQIEQSTTLLDYKGDLCLSIDPRHRILLASKSNYRMSVVPKLKKYIHSVEPYNFSSLILISGHPVIRKFELFDFYNHDFVSYKGQDAVKINFRLSQKNGGQSGYLIIDTSNMAILSLSYEINPIHNWIGERTVLHTTKIDLTKFFIESNYSKDSTGKYFFNSGREQMVITVKERKKLSPIMFRTYMNRIKEPLDSNLNFQELKDLF